MTHPTDAAGSAVDRQLAVEQNHVDHMFGALDDGLAAARSALTDVFRQRSDGAVELHTRETDAARLSRRVRRLEDAEHGLCFGRLDTTGGVTLHIGRIGLRRDDSGDPLLVDWRADAARPFYAATPAQPLGLRRRRHLRLHGRMVSEVSDELLTGSDPAPDDIIGDGPLVEVLAAARTGRMRDAAATLQSEQDAIVRSRHRGVTVVQGGPGTGKTVVALHRAAFVLYDFPGVADSGVLVVGPNSRFLDYIGHVLPSLGENDVVLTTIDDLARGIKGSDLAAADDVEGRLKGRAVLADALATEVKSRRVVPSSVTVPVGGDPITLGADVVAEARARAAGSGLPHNPARAVLKDHLADALVRALEAGALAALKQVDADVAKMTGMDFDKAAASDLRGLGLDANPVVDVSGDLDLDAVRDELDTDPMFDRAVDRVWPRLDPDDVVRAVLADPRVPGFTESEADALRWNGAWTTADAPLLDEAAALLDGPPGRSFGHVVIDEAQELTPMQWRVVLRRCPVRSMTVVGDFAQAGPAAEARNWHEALAPHVGDRFDLRTLTVNYRTTAEILEATRDLLTRIAPGQELSRSLRHGDDPRDVGSSPGHETEVVRRLIAEDGAEFPGDLVGVVCAGSRAADLAPIVDPTGARLVPASEARGLEFDAVIVVDPAGLAADRAGGERDLYVALTRATKRLITVTVT